MPNPSGQLGSPGSGLGSFSPGRAPGAAGPPPAGVPLSGAVIAQASASAIPPIWLSAGAGGQASSTATLVGAALVGESDVQASLDITALSVVYVDITGAGSADAGLTVSLAGQAGGSSTVTSDELTGPIQNSNATAQASSTGALTLGLVGAAHTPIRTFAAAFVAYALSGSSQSSAPAAGPLTTGLAGRAAAQSTLSTTGLTTIRGNGAAAAQVSGSLSLSLGIGLPGYAPVNVALGTTATVVNNWSQSPVYLTDGDPTTYWDSSTHQPNAWFYLDLRQTTYIAAFRLWQWTDCHRSDTFNIQGSNDATNWSTALYSSPTGQSGDTGIRLLTTAASYRYWRFNGTGPDLGCGWNIWEVYLYPGTAPVSGLAQVTGGLTVQFPASSSLGQGSSSATIQAWAVLIGGASGQGGEVSTGLSINQPFVAPASLFATGGAPAPYVTSQLGAHYSSLGTSDWQLGASPFSPTGPPQLLAPAAIRTSWATMGRVTQVAFEVAEIALPSARITQAAVETITTVTPSASVTQAAIEIAEAVRPNADITQAALEVAEQGTPQARLTQFSTEISTSPPPPPVDITQFAFEALVAVPPWVQANARLLAVSRNNVPYGNAWIRTVFPQNKEQSASAFIHAVYPLQVPVPSIPNPTRPPAVVVLPGQGSLQPGTYGVGYTWTDPYGETQISPITTVTITQPNSAIGIGFTETPPPGAENINIYTTATNDPTGSLYWGETMAVTSVPSDVPVRIPITPQNVVVTTNYHNNNDPDYDGGAAFYGYSRGDYYGSAGLPAMWTDVTQFPDLSAWGAVPPVLVQGASGPMPPGGVPIWPEEPAHADALDPGPPGQLTPDVTSEVMFLDFHFDRPAAPNNSTGVINRVNLEWSASADTLGLVIYAALNNQFSVAPGMRCTAVLNGVSNGLVRTDQIAGNPDDDTHFHAWDKATDNILRMTAPRRGPVNNTFYSLVVNYGFAAIAVTQQQYVTMGKGPPPQNTTGTPPSIDSGNPLSFDHDFRDPKNVNYRGVMGHYPPPGSRMLVVRSGDQDIGNTPTGDHLTNPVVAWMYKPASDPGNTFYSHVTDQSGTVTERFDAIPAQGGSLASGVYRLYYTLVDGKGNESAPSQGVMHDGLDRTQIYEYWDTVLVDGTQGEGSITIKGGFDATHEGPTAVNDDDKTGNGPAVGIHIYAVGPVSVFPPVDSVAGPQLAHRQTTTPIPLIQTTVGNPLTGFYSSWATSQDFTFTTLDTTSPLPPEMNMWPLPTPDADPSNTATNWYDLDYVPLLVANATPDQHAWSAPLGGFPGGSAPVRLFNEWHSIAFYNPHWPALPSAPIMTHPDNANPLSGVNAILAVPAVNPTGPQEPSGWSGTAKETIRTYYRHTWTAPAGTVSEDALLTMRFDGRIEDLFINGLSIFGGSQFIDARYWDTRNIRIGQSLLRAGKNVLAFKLRPPGQDITGAPYYPGPSGGTFQGGADDVHVPSGNAQLEAQGLWKNVIDNTTQLADVSLAPPFQAYRPDQTTRAYYDHIVFRADAKGFQDPEDQGPGYWGFWGFGHNPQYSLRGSWDGTRPPPISGQLTPAGSEQVMWGRGWAWPPSPDMPPNGMELDESGWPLPGEQSKQGGFQKGYVFVQDWDGMGSSTITFAIGYDHFQAYADRWSMPFLPTKDANGNYLPGVWRIGGGGHTSLERVMASTPDEWAPGASYLLAYPIQGSAVDAIERTAFNGIVTTDTTTPLAKDPGHGGLWDDPKDIVGQIVVTVPVHQLQQVYITAASRFPVIHNLGRGRLYVFVLDQNEQRVGRLTADNEYLGTTFGEQPATLWPYSENMFWTATNPIGNPGPWQSAAFLQVVFYIHQEEANPTRDAEIVDPNQGKYGEWMLNITVREKAVAAIPTKPFGQWVG